VKTVARYSAKTFAFSRSVRAQLPSIFLKGGMLVIGILNCLVAFQIELSSLDRLVMYVNEN
jgi:hypothetical protein